MMDKTDYSNNTCYYSTVTDRVYYYYYSSLLLVPYYNNNIIINRRRFYYYLFVIIIILYGFDELSNTTTMITVVDAFATGAGGCERGQAAVDGIHLIGDNERIVLVEINPGWVLEINDIPVTQYDIIHIRPNGKYRLTVISSSLTNTTTFYKGVLIRIEQGSGTNITFIPEDVNIAQDAGVCLFPIYGITHVDNTIKSTLSGIFSTTLEDDVRIDITVVTYNNNSGSVFSHRAYTASVIPAPAPSSYMTFKPTQSFQPTNTLLPTTTTGPCYVCGSPDLYVTNHNSTIILDNYLYTCKRIEDMGRRRQFTSDQCIAAVQAITSITNNCNCSSNTLSTTTTISPMPTMTITPTIAPSTTTTTTMYPTTMSNNNNNNSDDNTTTNITTTTLIPTISPPIEASTTTSSSAATAASMTRTTITVLLGRITTTTTTTTNALLLFTTIIISQVAVWDVLF